MRRTVGLDPDEFILRNADPIWLVQHEMWDLLGESERRRDGCAPDDDDTVIEGPFAGDERVEPEIVEVEFECDDQQRAAPRRECRGDA